MHWFRDVTTRFIDSGIMPDTNASDERYIRFLNMTLLIFGFAQLPILSLLALLGLTSQLLINLSALGCCLIGFILNIHKYYLPAKILVVGAVTANTAYFAAVIGSSAPTHLWLIPTAVLGVLTFKTSEWRWAAIFICVSMISFFSFEFIQPDLKPMIPLFNSPLDERQAAHSSTVAAMILTLFLIGMMHQRFASSEAALSREKSQSDRLLRAILPDKIAQELRETGSTQAVRHDDVSLLFADIVGFTPLSASMPAEDVVALLATIFARFDSLITECGVEKIKTIGDAYMVAGGVPKPMATHAEQLANCAFGMLKIIEQFNAESGHQLQLRIGLHRGPAVAGVIGSTKFAYDLWGESVNLASRLESSGEPGRIHVSDIFRSSLNAVMKFESRGEITLKGVGPTHTHWLLSDNK